MEALLLLFVVGVALALYFLPTVVAMARGHRQTVPILLLNVFLGWTFLGWVFALIWSASAQDKAAST